MTLYINARFTAQRITGIQRYAMEITRAIEELVDAGEAPDIQLIAPGNASVKSIAKIHPVPSGQLSTLIWEQLVLPFRSAPGLLLNLCNSGPLAVRDQIVVVHDAAVFTQPKNYSLAYRLVYRFIIRTLLRKARTVVTVSSFSRNELAGHCGIPPELLNIVPCGCDHITRSPSDSSIIARSGLTDKRYVLAVGTPSRSKNLALLAEAVRLYGGADLTLALVGETAPGVFKTSAIDLPKHTKLLGYVSDAELRALYEHALCFVFPSRYEGFGIPPLEAMRCGCPTLVSTAASIPETCGDASLYFSPTDAGQLAALIQQLNANPALCNELRSRGYAHSQGYTWSAAATRLLALAGSAQTSS